VDDGYNGNDGHNGDNRYERRSGLLRMLMRMLKQLLPSNDTPKEKAIVSVLTKRCGMPREAAVRLAKQVKRDFKAREQPPR